MITDDEFKKRVQQCIEKRIEILLDEFNYEKRRLEHPDECPCNGSSPCHDIKDLNCLFCYCPNYNTEDIEGGCKIGNPEGAGYWFEHEGLPKGKVWDCSNCAYPHRTENVKDILSKLFNGKLT
jgi:Zn-finger protein